MIIIKIQNKEGAERVCKILMIAVRQLHRSHEET